MKKCPVGGFGTVDARIPLSQSVACGPTMEMSPLLESLAIDGPALTRDATAGGNVGIEDGKVDPPPSAESREMAVRSARRIGDQITEADSERQSPLSSLKVEVYPPALPRWIAGISLHDVCDL